MRYRSPMPRIPNSAMVDSAVMCELLLTKPQTSGAWHLETRPSSVPSRGSRNPSRPYRDRGYGMDLLPAVLHVRHIGPGDADMLLEHFGPVDVLCEAVTRVFR